MGLLTFNKFHKLGDPDNILNRHKNYRLLSYSAAKTTRKGRTEIDINETNWRSDTSWEKLLGKRNFYSKYNSTFYQK